MKLISALFFVGFAIFQAVCANASILAPLPNVGGGLSVSPAALISDLECSSLDGKSDLSLRHTPFGLRLAIHSQELSMYARIAYGIELGRLEAVRESDGTAIIEVKSNGFSALAYAPAAKRPDLLWSVEFVSAGLPAQSAQTIHSTVRLTDSQGLVTQLAVDCGPQSAP